MGVEFDRVTRGPIVNEARELGIDGFFACGNVLQVHDLVDYVTEEGEITGRAVTKYLNGESMKRTQPIKLIPDENVRVKLVKDNGKVLANYKKNIVTPGEIVTVYLPEALIDDKLGSLNICIEKEEETLHG